MTSGRRSSSPAPTAATAVSVRIKAGPRAGGGGFGLSAFLWKQILHLTAGLTVKFPVQPLICQDELRLRRLRAQLQLAASL